MTNIKNREKNIKLVTAIVVISIIIIGVIVYAMYTNDQDEKVKINSGDIQENNTKIKFGEMYEKTSEGKEISSVYQSFNGEKVIINGYMAVQSPLDESFIYLVGQPYVSCPFCTIGDITKLEIIQVLMSNGDKIKYVENGVTISGTLEVEEKVDSEGYTTQCRIYADKIVPMTDENIDKELQTYYANLSRAGMIIDIQTLQMDIEYATNEEYIKDYGTTHVEIIDSLAEYYQGISDYLKYIKECPDIIKKCEPTREDLINMNNQLLELYDSQIKVMEKFVALILEAQMQNTTDSRKEEIYNSLIKLNKDNVDMYEAFLAWDNKLRS